MRGLRRAGLLAISVVSVLAFTAAAAFADADDELFTKPTGVLVRDTATLPANQPHAIEIVNSGNTKLEVIGVATSECTESEFGTFVTKAKEPALSVPFGVFENCTVTGGAFAPVYLDTVAGPPVAAAATATVADTNNGVFKVTLKGLKLSLLTAAVGNCIFVSPAAGIVGTWTNGAGPFEPEESETNQTAVDFTGQELESEGNCAGAARKAKITAGKYFVETASDAKDFTGASDSVTMKS
jgi:hypothetical protein